MTDMKEDGRKQRIKYIISDFVASVISWFLMNLARYHALGRYDFDSLHSYLTSQNIVKGQLLVPVFWLIIYYYSGYYNSTRMKSRLAELKTTATSVLYGSLIIFFIIMVNDLPKHYLSYYKLLTILIVGQFVLTYIPRAIITARQTNSIHQRKKGFNTIVIGCGKNARNIINELNRMKISMGFFIKGCIDMQDCKPRMPQTAILGTKENLENIMHEYNIHKIIIAPDNLSNDNISQYLNYLYKYNVPIILAADKKYILTHSIKMNTIYATPLIEINRDNMPDGQKNVKQTLDILISAITLVLLSPLFLYLAIRVKMDSKGPVFYKQERLGKHGKPFNIYKFRTMYVNSEENGPALSSHKDKRITPFGKVMRKYRFDELPQFWNVLKGEMSLVGPRPERKYYAEQILQAAPYYQQIYTVKPGITSWGMVKFGYANTVEQMVDRLQYDIIYLDSRNLLVDTKILIYTFKTIFTGKGI